MKTKSRPRRGRPSRAERIASAPPIDLNAVDPRAVLRSIAGDAGAPASARVAAARELLRLDRSDDEGSGDQLDAVTRRALELISPGRLN